MKKYLVSLSIFLVLFLLPQVVLAVWWNPLTWDIFSWLKKSELQYQEIPDPEKDTVQPIKIDTTATTEKETEDVTHTEIPSKNSPAPSPQIIIPVSNTAAKQNRTESSDSKNINTEIRFQISDIKRNIGEEEVSILWQTTLPSRSRLTLTNGKVYESLNGIGTKHRVVIEIEPNKEYNYHITAKTLDEKQLEDEVFGSFEGPVELTAILGGTKNECRTIIIKNTGGKLIPNMKVTVRGINQVTSSKTTYVSYQSQQTEKTDSKGEIEYCEPATRYEISGENLWIKLP